ncbi:nucleotide-diphospho-sugar transferase [Mucilaginibacter sp.]
MNNKTPVLFLIFNRPDITQTVFNAIRKFKPAYLYVAADGPRAARPDDLQLCKAARAIIEQIDWDCNVKTLFRDENRGCGKAVSEAITWFFSYVEEGIILEDDCLPNESFFNFCECLLEKYRNKNQVMHIGGACFQDKTALNKNSYYFSSYIHIWGWATWKRAWSLYNYNISPDSNSGLLDNLKKIFPDKAEFNFWKRGFDDIASNTIDTWDTQWSYTVYKNNGIGITPTTNFISNIGFGANATHTLVADPKTTALPLTSIDVVRHPVNIQISRRLDRKTFKKLFQFGNTKFNRIKFIIGQKAPIVKLTYNSLFKARKTI